MFYSVAPPRGERGLKLITLQIIPLVALVAPPRGERGLKLVVDITKQSTATSRSPSWGAWIEIALAANTLYNVSVAPPRGERGLKWAFRTRPKPIDKSLPLVGSVD